MKMPKSVCVVGGTMVGGIVLFGTFIVGGVVLDLIVSTVPRPSYPYLTLCFVILGTVWSVFVVSRYFTCKCLKFWHPREADE